MIYDPHQKKHFEFDLSISLPPENGGNVSEVPECVLNRETQDDAELREKIIAGRVPTVDTIFRYQFPSFSLYFNYFLISP